jgi:hypothetical protein
VTLGSGGGGALGAERRMPPNSMSKNPAEALAAGKSSASAVIAAAIKERTRIFVFERFFATC